MDRIHAVTRCQLCNSQLTITGLDAVQNSTFLQPQYNTQSLLGTSFVGDGKLNDYSLVFDPSKQGRDQFSGQLDDSFFYVESSASVLKQGEYRTPQPAELPVPQESVDALFQRLARIFEVASVKTEVDCPMCLECAAQVKAQKEASLQDLEAELEAYQNTIDELEQEDTSEAALQALGAELKKLQAEEEETEAEAEQAEQELKVVQQELAQLSADAKTEEDLEERYWTEWNSQSRCLRRNAEKRTSLTRKIFKSEKQYERLREVNVWLDIFHIAMDGPYGTISGFRLGRLGTGEGDPVSWDEINAAWGQAVLLLDTMARVRPNFSGSTGCLRAALGRGVKISQMPQAVKVDFISGQLLPMGSYPRIKLGGKNFDLFGPPTLLSPYYDKSMNKAMTGFLACLKEFYEEARGMDRLAGRGELEIPYQIEGEKVGGVAICYPGRSEQAWTEALSFMLTNLMWALQWTVAFRSAKPFAMGPPPQSPCAGPPA